MHDRRRFFSGNNQRFTLVLIQVFRHRGDPLSVFVVGRICTGDAESLCNSLCDLSDLARLDRKSMLGFGSCKSYRGLDRVETIDLFLFFAELTSGGKSLDITNVVSRENIRVERQNPLGLFKFVDRLNRRTKCHLGTSNSIVSIDRLVLNPFRIGKFCLKFCKLIDKSWRGDRFGQKSYTGTAVFTIFFNCGPNFSRKSLIRLRISAKSGFLRAIWVIHSQDRRLCVNVCRTQTSWMIGIPLDLYRTSVK